MPAIVSVEMIIIGFLIGMLIYQTIRNRKFKKERERFPYVLKSENGQSIIMDADQIIFELFRKQIILMSPNTDEHQKSYDYGNYYRYNHPSGIIYTYPDFDVEHPIEVWANKQIINSDNEPWTKSVYDLAKEIYDANQNNDGAKL